MNPEEHGKLCAMYDDFRIDRTKPGFYDDKRFLRAESVDPSFIESYGRFVESRPCDEAYLVRSRNEIPEISSLVHRELVADGRLGACVDIGMILSRILEQEGFWNYIVTSLAVKPREESPIPCGWLREFTGFLTLP